MVDEPRADDEEGPASTSVAVHAHLAALRNGQVEQVHDLHHMLEGRGSHVLPTLVKASDSMGKKLLRDVAEPHSGDDAVCAEGMLSWFLQVEYCANILVLKPGIEVEILDESFGGALHGEYVLGDPVGMESFDGVGLHLVGEVVLLVAGVAPAELA